MQITLTIFCLQHYKIEASSDFPSAGDVLLKALKDLEIDEEIISRNIVSYTGGSGNAAAVGGSGGQERADNLASVEKSFAKLGVADEGVPHEDRDFTKESESCAEASDTEEQKQATSNYWLLVWMFLLFFLVVRSRDVWLFLNSIK